MMLVTCQVLGREAPPLPVMPLGLDDEAGALRSSGTFGLCFSLENPRAAASQACARP